MNDVMKNYKEYLESYSWKAVKKMKLEENSECEICGKLAISVHHLFYERLGKENENDIVSICESCHNDCHYVEGYQIKNNEEELRRRFEYLKGIDNKFDNEKDFIDGFSIIKRKVEPYYIFANNELILPGDDKNNMNNLMINSSNIIKLM